jgi:RNA polymerase sigma-70 factor, ECF subfamily
LEWRERIEAILTGNTELFEYVVECWQQPIFRYCLHMLGNRHDAEDAAQDVFVKAFEKLRLYRYDTSFSAWLYTIAYHHCINLIGKKKMLKALLPFIGWFTAEKNTETDQDERELRPDLKLALASLTVNERTLLFLRVLEDKPFDEIALILDTNAANLRKKYERLKRKMQLYRVEQEEKENEKFSII